MIRLFRFHILLIAALPVLVHLVVRAPAEPVFNGDANRHVMTSDHHRAERCPVTVILYARQDAPASGVPAMVRFTARPMQDGRAGAALPTQSFPLMVVRREGAER